MTRDVDAIRADLAARTVHGSASSAADRDISALLTVIDGLRRDNGPMRIVQVDRVTGKPATIYTPPEDVLVVRVEP